MARVGEGKRRQTGQVALLDTLRVKVGRQANRLSERTNCARALERQRALVVAADAELSSDLGDAVGDRHAVEVEHGRKTDCVGEPVVHPELSRQRMRERVAGAEALLKRDSAHHGGLEHVSARLQIVAVVGRRL